MAKILMITGLGSATDLASGKRGAFYNTLEEFSKYWERIDIICPRIPRGSTSGGFEIEPLFGNVFLHISPWPLIFHPVWFLKKGIQIYKEQKFDLMTVHEFPPFYNGIGAKLLWYKIRVPYILEIFHIPGYPRVSSFKEFIYKFFFKIFIRFDASTTKAIRVMNGQMVEQMTHLGVPRSKINLIPAAYIDLDVFRPMNLTKEYDLIFIGRLEKNKGISLLLDAVKKLKFKNDNLKLLIVGAGPLAEELKLKVKNEKLEKQVVFHGWASDSREIAEILNKSKILVMPSYNEGGPRVVLEAMACGTPVLATLVGIVPDLFKNAPGGEIINWEADDIASKAGELLSNSDKYKEYSINGLEIAKQFERKEAIKNYADRLKEIIA